MLTTIAEPPDGGRGYWTISLATSAQDFIDMFPKGHADYLNWLFLSTSGIHGSYKTLDEWTPESPKITMLAICPRTLRMTFGDVEVTKEQIPILRRFVRQTLEEVAKTQEGNRERPNSTAGDEEVARASAREYVKTDNVNTTERGSAGMHFKHGFLAGAKHARTPRASLLPSKFSKGDSHE